MRDFSEIYDRDDLKRALIVSAIGRIPVLLTDACASGLALETAMLYRTILPPMDAQERDIARAARLAFDGASLETATRFAIVIDRPPSPGELSSAFALAAEGVIVVRNPFEWEPQTLDALRSASESGTAQLSEKRFECEPYIIATRNLRRAGEARQSDCFGIEYAFTDGARQRPRVLPTTDSDGMRTAVTDALAFSRANAKAFERMGSRARLLFEILSDSLSLSESNRAMLVRIARAIADLERSETIARLHILEAATLLHGA